MRISCFLHGCFGLFRVCSSVLVRVLCFWESVDVSWRSQNSFQREKWATTYMLLTTCSAKFMHFSTFGINQQQPHWPDIVGYFSVCSGVAATSSRCQLSRWLSLLSHMDTSSAVLLAASRLSFLVVLRYVAANGTKSKLHFSLLTFIMLWWERLRLN